MFTSRFNRVLAIVTWLMCSAAVVAVAVSGQNAGLHYLPLIAFVAWMTWAGLWNPRLVFDDHVITVVNVLTTTVIPWAALIQVDTHYALTLVTPHRRYAVTVAPAPGRLSTALSTRDMKGISAPMSGDGSVQAGDIPSSDSGAAAHLIRQRWERLLAEGRINVGTADSAAIHRRHHGVIMMVAGTLAVISAIALALG